MKMRLMTQMRRQRRRCEASSTGQVPGIYLRAERRSAIEFSPVFLGNQGNEHACGVLEKALDRLYASHGINNVVT